MKRALGIFNLLVFTCLLVACDQDEENSSKAEILCAGTGQWIMVGYVAEYGATTNNIDIYELVKPCEQDDISRFKKGGSFDFLGGNTKCDPDENDWLDGGTWKLISNETQIQFTRLDGTASFADFFLFNVVDIVSLDADTLVVSVDIDNGNGTSTKFIGTFSKQ